MRAARHERGAFLAVRGLMACACLFALLAVVACGNTAGQSGSGTTSEEAAEGIGEEAAESTSGEAVEKDAEEAVDGASEEGAEETSTQQRSSTSLTRTENYRSLWKSKTGSTTDKGEAGEQDDAQTKKDTALEVVRESTPQSSRYTVMVYMIGSNLESSGGAASEDIAEMLGSGVDFSKANVVVYTGGSRRWNSDVPSDHNSVLDLARAEGDRIVAQTATPVSMGSAPTLSSFLQFCHDHYQAEHMALVFWDHGGGPLWGFGVDENNSGDGLLLSELKEALEASPYAKDEKAHLDWVGFDACLMGCLENAALWSDYASWMVASEEVEPGDGWDYAFLQTLNGSDDPKTIAQSVLDAYDAHYKKIATTLSNPDVTLAAFDLSQAKGVVNALSDLAFALEGDVSAGSYAQVNRARRGAKAFGLSAVDTRTAAYDLVDLVDLADCLQETHPKEAEKLSQAAGKLIAAHVGNVERANGVSLYFPGENRELFETFDTYGRESSGDDQPDDKTESSKNGSPSKAKRGLGMLSSAYDDFVATYTDAWLDSTDIDWTLAEPQMTDEGASLSLTESQSDALMSASYTLLHESDAGSYIVLTSEVDIPLSSEGTLTVPQDPLVICSKTDLHRAVPGWFIQVESNDKSATYVNRNLYLNPAGDFTDFDITIDPPVSVTVEVDNKTGDVGIESISASDEAVSMGGRSSVDVTQYTALMQMNYRGGMLHVGYDANDAPLPWEEWGSGGFIYNVMPVEDGFGFVTMPASEILESYAVQIVVTDVNGNRHATAPIMLKTNNTPRSEGKKTTQRTELGKLTLTVFDDHAEVTKYEGDDWTVDIPAKVEGKPLTAIGERAFSGARYLDELVVPEGVTDIGASAFTGSGLYAITLPSTLEHVAPAAFSEMSQLTKFELKGKSKLLSVRDGVLFSADGSTLISYPNAKGTSYSVPDGTTSLAYSSFAKTGIKSIELPEGLASIGVAAFYDCESLESVELPQSLERVGTLAFGRGYYSDGAPVTSVRLGPHVSYVGGRAFDGLNLSSIEVDPANTHYTERGGCLLNAAGDAILEAPMAMGKVVEVPEGVVSLNTYTFYSYDNDTEFILPATLVSCENTSLPYALEDDEEGNSSIVYRCEIHTPEGSYMERWAADRGITCDNVCDRSLLVYETREVEQDGYTLQFRVYANRAVLVSVGSPEGGSTPGMDGAREHELVIPSDVDGVPVTEIAIDEMLLSDGFWYPSEVESLVLPATLQTVGGSGFSDFSGLTELRVEGDSPYLAARDGVLFSADGTTLVAYPVKRPDAYVVPEGTKEIASNAFCDADLLTEVTLPDSVEDIGPKAFSNCDDLASVHFGSGLRSLGDDCFYSCESLVLSEPLPRRLRTIGENAFYHIASYEGLELPKDVQSIGRGAFSGGYVAQQTGKVLKVNNECLSIGSHLTELDGSAFEGLGITSFEVAKSSKHFRAEGPFLMTADGRQLVAFASGYEGDAVIPSSVHEVKLSLFSTAYNLKSLTIPPSVTYLSTWYTGSGDVKPTFEVHVSKGSTAERVAWEEGLSWIVD